MERKQASDFDPEVLNLFDQYVHGVIDRRGFLERAARFAVGGVTAAMLLDALNPRFAEAQQIAKDDRRLATSHVEYDSPKGTGKVRGYLALPAKRSGRLPGVLVVHENRGLNPHIEDVARRIALEQYVAFAPDALTPLGGYPGDEDKARELFGKLDQGQDPPGLRGRGGFPEEASRMHRQGRRGGLLLRRRDRQPIGHAHPRTERGGAVLRQPTAGRGRGEDQGAAPHPLRREGRPHQRRHPGVRGRAQGQPRELRNVHLPRHAARLQQRHHSALRQSRRGSPGSGPWTFSRRIYAADAGASLDATNQFLAHRGPRPRGAARRASGWAKGRLWATECTTFRIFRVVPALKHLARPAPPRAPGGTAGAWLAGRFPSARARRDRGWPARPRGAAPAARRRGAGVATCGEIPFRASARAP